MTKFISDAVETCLTVTVTPLLSYSQFNQNPLSCPTMQFFTAIFILVAIITADDNEKSDGGFRVVGFTGIWTAFMMTAIMSVAAQVC